VLLDDIAHVRAGDKGDTLILTLRAREPGGFTRLRDAVTHERVAGHFASVLTGPVERRELPSLEALVLVLPGALGGGVTGSPTLDGHGKTLGYHLLAMPLD
jgi:hypothetical protein